MTLLYPCLLQKDFADKEVKKTVWHKLILALHNSSTVKKSENN